MVTWTISDESLAAIQRWAARYNIPISNERTTDADKAIILIEAAKHAPDWEFPRGKWATIQAMQADALNAPDIAACAGCGGLARWVCDDCRRSFCTPSGCKSKPDYNSVCSPVTTKIIHSCHTFKE